MINAVTGAAALAMIVVFLGYYVVMVSAPPLWIIICLILVLVACDYVQSLREAASSTQQDPS
jgi:hypothetical protein